MSEGYRAIKANALPMVALWLLAATPDAAGHAAFGEPARVPQVGPKGMAVALEGNRLFAGAGATLYALDVTDPLKPRLLGSLDGFDNLRQMCVRGRFAYVVSRETGMRIVDVSDPANMRIRALYDKETCVCMGLFRCRQAGSSAPTRTRWQSRRAALYHGKALIPAGYQGLLMEKDG